MASTSGIFGVWARSCGLASVILLVTANLAAAKSDQPPAKSPLVRLSVAERNAAAQFVQRSKDKGLLLDKLKVNFELDPDALHPNDTGPTIQDDVEFWTFNSGTPGVPKTSDPIGYTEPRWAAEWKLDKHGGGELTMNARSVVGISGEILDDTNPFLEVDLVKFTGTFVHELQHARQQLYVLRLIRDACAAQSVKDPQDRVNRAEHLASAFFVDLATMLKTDDDNVAYSDPEGNQLAEAFASNETFLVLAQTWGAQKKAKVPLSEGALSQLKALAIHEYGLAQTALERGKKRLDKIEQSGKTPKDLAVFLSKRPAKAHALHFPFPIVTRDRTGPGVSYFEQVDFGAIKGSQKDAVEAAIESVLANRDPLAVAYDMDGLDGT